MSDVASRILMTLALWAALPAVFALGGFALPDGFRDETFRAAALATFVGMGLYVWLWRRFVRWSVGRSAASVSLLAVVLGHLILWQPMWDAGCVTDVLITAQQEAVFSLVAIGLACVWWSWAFARLETHPRRQSMSAMAVRLVICSALIPLAPAVFWIAGSACDEFDIRGPFADYRNAVLPAALTVWLVLVLAWRTAVTWTARRVTLTLGLFAVTVAMPIVSPWLPSPTGNSDFWPVVLTLGAGPVLLAGIALFWRDDRAPRGTPGDAVEQRLKCPACGYLMTGLHEARCPECGQQYTLDELYRRILTPDGVG